ncbi:heavy-metal-associated domain-containing protein [Desulfallas sp. Bu1-1]|jgi:copper chaperone CopZ|nr:heavy-metal-associated domain-containing protein [Desulfallas sp. Bu1-1]
MINKNLPEVFGLSEAQNAVRETIRVGGLRDEDGKKEIEHNLIQVDGVRDVRVSLNDQTVYVDYDAAVISGDYIRRTLNSLGYSPYVRY